MPTTKPEIRGEKNEWRDGRYRLYTIEHLPFDALPDYSDGGPATVSNDGWSTSTSSLCRLFSSANVVAEDDGGATVSATRDGHYVNAGTPEVEYVVTRHEIDGRRYPTQQEARRAQYEAGVTARMVYERDAHKWEATAS